MIASAECEPPAIRSFENIADAYVKPGLIEIPYFDGDNWPDILEDILKLDKKQEDERRKKEELRKQIEAMQAEAWASMELRPRCRKPKALQGYYEGQPPPRKRTKQQETVTKRPGKAKLTADARLHLVMQSSKRDFLVVRLCDDGGGVKADIDEDVKLAMVGSEHSVSSFFRSEKLEFSTLRHAKFSTMILLYALLADGPFEERYPGDDGTGTAGREDDMAAAAADNTLPALTDGGEGGKGASTDVAQNDVKSNSSNGDRSPNGNLFAAKRDDDDDDLGTDDDDLASDDASE